MLRTNFMLAGKCQIITLVFEYKLLRYLTKNLLIVFICLDFFRQRQLFQPQQSVCRVYHYNDSVNYNVIILACKHKVVVNCYNN